MLGASCSCPPHASAHDFACRANHPVKPAPPKYFSLSEFGFIVGMICPARQKGRIASRHETRVGMRWTRTASARRQSQGGSHRERDARARRRRRRVRQNRVVLAAVAAVKLGGGASTRPGFAASSIREAMVTKRIRRQGERGISRQPAAQGRPGCLGCPVFSPCIACAMFSTGPTGASRHPAFPAPSFRKEGEDEQSSGKPCRENADARSLFEI
jgi:hypothetical protein